MLLAVVIGWILAGCSFLFPFDPDGNGDADGDADADADGDADGDADANPCASGDQDGKRCDWGRISGGKCCGRRCVDLETDEQNCGACERLCEAGRCVGGACECGRGLTPCARSSGDVRCIAEDLEGCDDCSFCCSLDANCGCEGGSCF